MSLYKTDQFVREAIDILLKRNAARQASLGTESEPEDRLSVKQDWKDSLKIISVIDPEFWGVIQE
tara:strand:- start:288 stop:482 length:195 start_codon:yes stop_codon:yes gene_type:complete